MVKDMTTYYISDRWRDYGTPEFKKNLDEKTPVGWDSLLKTGRKRVKRKDDPN